MTSEIAVPDDSGVSAPSSFDSSLAAEQVAVNTMMRSITRSIVICLPLGIAFFIGLLALAVGDDLGWWTIIGLGSLLGVLGAVLFGMLGGVTVAAHALEDVDRGAAVDHDAH
jgi:UPF0716 family protein affecting phage T7 exclusion